MNWLLADCRTVLPHPWGYILITLSAVVCGAMVGWEREKRDKPAGLRTLMLVCLGSASFTMVSFAFGTTTGDTGRVAAQIVTGVGFLGAGVILHGRTAVTGLTTAATIWATAALGVVLGAGYITAGIGLGAVIRGVLSGVALWERKFARGIKTQCLELLVDPDHGKARIRLERLLHDFQLPERAAQVSAAPDGTLRVLVTFHLPQRQRLDFLHALAELREVREIRPLPASE